ncbi:MAG: hypothetical protein WCY62_09255 [Clostridia bacterium]|jgi:mannitol-1-phosphate 5-dehydrogenase
METAVVFGAGNIGRGLAGRILTEAGFTVSFIDVNDKLNKLINLHHSYPLYITKGNEYEMHTIRNVSAIDGKDISAICDITDEAKIAATAVGVNALKYIIPTIATIIKHRYKNKNTGYLNFILCENMIDVHAYVRTMLKDQLSSEENEYADKYIGFCQSSIGCMVPSPPAELLEKNPLTVCVEDYNKIYTDMDGSRGDFPEIENILPYSPFSYYINRKLFMHNMSHCVCAYWGYQKGYTYIWEAINDEEIRAKVSRALEETSSALSIHYGTEMRELNAHADDLVKRYGNRLLGDTIARVGADPKRKLGRNDRLIGAAVFCLENSIMPTTIIETIPIAFRFDPENDPSAAEVHSYYTEHGLAESLKKYSSISETDPIFNKILSTASKTAEKPAEKKD